ncbi:tetratricopeptide repeat protein, partial [Pseudomonadota bacterium]
MKRYTVALMVALLCVTGTASSVAYAGKKKQLSQQAYKALMAAQESLEKGEATKAIGTLKGLLIKLEKRPYERAIILQSISHAHISQENYSAAIPPLKQSVDLAVLPDEPQQQARYNLIRLLMATEKFTDAINQLKIWFAQIEQPQAEAYVMLATARLQLAHYQKAIKPLRTAIKISKNPKESWYQSLLGVYSELKQYDHCTTLLHTMLKLF